MKKQRIIKLVSAVLALSILVSCAPKSTVKRGSDSKGWYEIVEGEIPENNPKPVDITREDAWVPTPISFTDKMVGKEMNVEANTHIIGHSNREWKDHIAVIRSYDEFNSVFEKDNEKSDRKFNKAEYYNDFYSTEFFEDNVLIMLFMNNAGASGDKCTVEKVTKKSDNLYIFMKQINRSNLMDMVSFRVFISISKESLEGITNAVVYKEHVRG